jgi:uncharacterized membrane protein
MINLKTIGRVFFAIPIVVFGVQYLTYGRFARGLPPVPPWAPGGAAAAYLTGGLLVAGGVCILANVQVRLSSAVLGLFCFLCVAALHTMKLTTVIYQGGERTGALEALALAAAAGVLAASSPAGLRVIPGWQPFTEVLGRAGLYLFAFSMLIFGVQHFMYAPYIATLIPAWMPAHLFLTYFTGAAFIAAAIAIATGIQARLGAGLLGLMFLFVDRPAACSASICSHPQQRRIDQPVCGFGDERWFFHGGGRGIQIKARNARNDRVKKRSIIPLGPALTPIRGWGSQRPKIRGGLLKFNAHSR